MSNTSARSLRILIGSDLQDWSATYSLLSVGYESLGDRTNRGLIAVTGTLTLLNSSLAPESISPRSNPSRWRPGQPVYIQCRNDDNSAFVDTWFSRLIILEEPTEPISGPIELSLGCKLAWARSPQLEDDQSGVVFGTSENSSVVASRLLQASEISPADINLNTWSYSINYPFGKDTSSFAGQAGELAWSNDGRVLYQDTAGDVVDKLLSLTPTTAIATLTTGVNALLWQPLQDPQQPMEITKCAGSGQLLTTLTNPLVDTETSADSEQVITESFTVSDGTTLSIKTKVTELKERESAIYQDGDFGLTDEILLFQEITETERYEANVIPTEGRLLDFTVETKQRGKSLDPDDPVPNMRVVKRVTTTPTYGTDDAILSQRVLEEQAEILLDDTSSNFFDIRTIRDVDTTYERIASGIYSIKTVTDEALIAQDSTSDKTIVDIWELTRKTTKSSPRNENAPPDTKRFDASTFADEIVYEGTASYVHRGGATGRTREDLITINFGFSNPQMALLAALHRDLIIGRHLGDEIELSINNTLLVTPPLPEIHVVDGSDTYKYLGDSLSLEFSTNTASAHCIGIWMTGGYV